MGRPKPLLPYGRTTFLEHILGLYTGSAVGKTVVVLGRNPGPPRPDIHPEGTIVVFNPHPERGQISSLVAGIEALESHNPSAVIVHPVDHPAVTSASVRRIVSAALLHSGKIVIPVCGGRRGHPVVFPSKFFGELKCVPEGQGARAVIRARNSEIHEVETEDPGILTDIDTPEEYERLR